MLASEAGVTIKNTKIKPKVAEVFSKAMKMPLQLISGSIASLSINKPWQKLFLMVNSPIKITVEGVHIRTKLESSVCEKYILKQR